MENTIIQFSEKQIGIFNTISERISNNLGKARSRNADYLFVLLVDKVIDQYYYTSEYLENKLENIETSLLEVPEKIGMEDIVSLRKEIIAFRKILFPVKESIKGLKSEIESYFNEVTVLYFNDVNDHIIDLSNNIESFRENLNNLIELFHANTANKMNNVMMTLTIIATIFIPLTFLAGIYGMNFQFMPELKWKWSYPVLIATMVLLGTGMYVYMKKHKWF
jgi:magnesium transporter